MKMLINFENQAIDNLRAIKGGNQHAENTASQERTSGKEKDVVTEEITFVVEDLQIA